MDLNMKKRKSEIFPVSNKLAYFPVFLPFTTISAILRTKYLNILPIN